MESPTETASTNAPQTPLVTQNQTASNATGIDPSQQVITIIAEQTGYTTDDIELDYELEADLGIDTVKQAEIFSTLQEQFGIGETDTQLSEVQTIAALIEWVKTNADDKSESALTSNTGQQDTPAAPQLEASTTETQIEATGASTAGVDSLRQRKARSRNTSSPNLESNRTPPSTSSQETLDPHRTTKTTQQEPVADLPKSIRLQTPVRVPSPIYERVSLQGRSVLVLGNHPCRPHLLATLESMDVRQDSQPDLVIDLGAQLNELFEKAKLLDASPPKDWLCLTQLSKHSSDSQTAVLGGRSGLCKSLSREWTKCRGRVIDIHPDTENERIAQILINECEATDQLLETYHQSGERYALLLAPMELPPARQFDKTPHVVLTGGARGITAEVAKMLVRKGVTKLVLMGRSKPADTPLDVAEAKNNIRQRLSQTGRPTPRAIEDAMRPLYKAEEARHNIERLESMGAEVHFVAVDVTDRNQLTDAFFQAQNHLNGIDIVIHGAGLEESRMLKDKEWSDFLRIYTPKTTAALMMLELLPPECTFVSMGSIAGRFGNAGQIDYSAANDAVAKICIRRPNSLHVDWSAWADVGMASRGGMSTLLTKRGIELLPPEPAAALLVDLLLADQQGEVLVAGALGDMSSPSAHPFLSTFQSHSHGNNASWTLDANEHQWILDHSIKGTPVLPGVMGVELMASLAQFNNPTLEYCGARQVEFSRPVKLHRNQSIQINVDAIETEDGQYRCAVKSTRQAATGKTLEADHFTGHILLQPEQETPDLPDYIFDPYALEAKEIYRHFFHGPRFQVLSRVLELGVDGGCFEGSVNHSGIIGGLVSMPLVLEAAFQAAGLHRMIVDHTMCLPAGFDQLEVFPAAIDGTPLEIRVQLTEAGYHIDIDTDTEAVLRLRGLRFADTGPFDGAGLLQPSGGFKKGNHVDVQFSVPDASLFDTPDWNAYHLRGTPKRIQDRLAGRSAAKKALANRLNRLPQTLRIDNDPLGKPFCREFPKVHLSISHADGLGVAAISDTPVGIDIEQLQPRSKAFCAKYFSEHERSLVQNHPVQINLLWSIKEAVLKLLGLGLRVSARDIHIDTLGEFHATISVHGKVAALFGSHVANFMRIRYRQVHNYCMAMACWASHTHTLTSEPSEGSCVAA